MASRLLSSLSSAVSQTPALRHHRLIHQQLPCSSPSLFSRHPPSIIVLSPTSSISPSVFSFVRNRFVQPKIFRVSPPSLYPLPPSPPSPTPSFSYIQNRFFRCTREYDDRRLHPTQVRDSPPTSSVTPQASPPPRPPTPSPLPSPTSDRGELYKSSELYKCFRLYYKVYFGFVFASLVIGYVMPSVYDSAICEASPFLFSMKIMADSHIRAFDYCGVPPISALMFVGFLQRKLFS